jgi:hypothetical protein
VNLEILGGELSLILWKATGGRRIRDLSYTLRTFRDEFSNPQEMVVKLFYSKKRGRRKI